MGFWIERSVTRRNWLLASAAAAALRGATAGITIPVHHIIDAGAGLSPARLTWFRTMLWTEAARDFAQLGITFPLTESSHAVQRTPGGMPRFEGLVRGALNFVITHQLPLAWDAGRGVAGVATVYDGYHVDIAALDHAHGHRIPFLAVNTCTHELLHVLLGDIFERRPAGWRGSWRETRIDAIATRLWLTGGDGGGEIATGARRYAVRLAQQLPAYVTRPGDSTKV
ncbi:MAG: hypothetical protein IT162_01910 [Bryobacterales bacterium]|nr:hypothetical protein [Bryobacterales bacterium]